MLLIIGTIVLDKQNRKFLEYTKAQSADLGEYLDEICHMEFAFSHEHPLAQSSVNHRHLWKLEYEAERQEWINLDYKVRFVKTIFSYWREHLKSYKEFYRSGGFLMYLYEDTSPTISVIANTPDGCPYHSLKFVNDIRKVLERYESFTWSDSFKSDFNFDYKAEKRLLKVIEKNHGSIGKPSADILGVKIGELRKIIINMGLGNAVNEIRKENKKRPADFNNELPEEHYIGLAWEGILPPNF